MKVIDGSNVLITNSIYCFYFFKNNFDFINKSFNFAQSVVQGCYIK